MKKLILFLTLVSTFSSLYSSEKLEHMATCDSVHADYRIKVHREAKNQEIGELEHFSTVDGIEKSLGTDPVEITYTNAGARALINKPATSTLILIGTAKEDYKTTWGFSDYNCNGQF